MASDLDKHDTLDLTAMTMLVVLCASWGLQQVAVKVASQGVPPILQSSIRSISAAILVGLWMVARRESMWERDGTLGWGIVAGLLSSGQFIFVYLGLQLTAASRAAIFLYLSPFVVALGAQLFIPGERMRLIQVVGLCGAFIGIVVAFSESWRLPTHQMLTGDAMIAGAAVLWGTNTVMIKASPLSTIVPSKTLLYLLVVSGLAQPIVSVAIGERGIVSMTPLIAGSLVYQIVWVTSITFVAWFWLIRHYPASRIAAFTFLTPLFGVLAGGVLLHEPITTRLLVALVLVATGIYLVNRPPARP